MRFLTRPSTCIALFALLVATALGGTAWAAEGDMNDAYTELKVRERLLDKLGRDALGVRIAANGNRVTLAGTVGGRDTQELAKEVALSVDGVDHVDVNLEVAPASPPDRGSDPDDEVQEEIDNAELELEDALVESKVKVTLIDKIGFDAFEIEVEATDGVVTLRGEVDADERDNVLTAARGVSQVDKVVDLLTVDSD